MPRAATPFMASAVPPTSAATPSTTASTKPYIVVSKVSSVSRSRTYAFIADWSGWR